MGDNLSIGEDIKKDKNSSSFMTRFIKDFEIYLGAYIFIFLTILLFIQVVSRYVFRNAITWTEEISNILFVALTYLGVSAAVKHRKHLSIDFFIELMPFKVKKTLLIISDIVFLGFCVYMLIPMISIVNSFGGFGGAKSPLLGIPKMISFGIIPVCFIFTIFRIIQDIVKLRHEEEKELGASKPTLDLSAAEAEWEQNKKLIEGGND